MSVRHLLVSLKNWDLYTYIFSLKKYKNSNSIGGSVIAITIILIKKELKGRIKYIITCLIFMSEGLGIRMDAKLAFLALNWILETI